MALNWYLKKSGGLGATIRVPEDFDVLIGDILEVTTRLISEVLEVKNLRTGEIYVPQ